MLKDFKAFIDRGNLLQLAVAFIMGVTFAAVVTSLVNDIIMPAVGLATGGVDFTSLFAVIKEGDPPGPYNTVAPAQRSRRRHHQLRDLHQHDHHVRHRGLRALPHGQGLHEDPEARGRGSHHQGLPVLLHEHPEGRHPLPELHLGAACRRSLMRPSRRPRRARPRCEPAAESGRRGVSTPRLPSILAPSWSRAEPLDPQRRRRASSPPAPATPRGCWPTNSARLGAADARETRGGATFTGPLSLAYRACLWSRMASRVLLRLASFPIGEHRRALRRGARHALGGPSQGRRDPGHRGDLHHPPGPAGHGEHPLRGAAGQGRRGRPVPRRDRADAPGSTWPGPTCASPSTSRRPRPS